MTARGAQTSPEAVEMAEWEDCSKDDQLQAQQLAQYVRRKLLLALTKGEGPWRAAKGAVGLAGQRWVGKKGMEEGCRQTAAAAPAAWTKWDCKQVT